MGWVGVAVLCLLGISYATAETHQPVDEAHRKTPATAGQIVPLKDVDEGALAARDLTLQTKRTDIAVGMMYWGAIYNTLSKDRNTNSPFWQSPEKMAKQISMVIQNARAHQLDRPFYWENVIKPTIGAARSKNLGVIVGVAVGSAAVELTLSNDDKFSDMNSSSERLVFRANFDATIGEFATDPLNFIYSDNYKAFVKMAKTDPKFWEILKFLPEDERKLMQDIASGKYIPESPSVQRARQMGLTDSTNEGFKSLNEEVGKFRRSSETRAHAHQNSMKQMHESINALEKKVSENSLSADDAYRLLQAADVELQLERKANEKKRDEDEQKDEPTEAEKRKDKAEYAQAVGNATVATLGLLQHAAKDDPKTQTVLAVASAGAELATMMAVTKILEEEAISPASYLNLYATGIKVGLQILHATQSRNSGNDGFKAILKSIQQLREMIGKMDQKLSGIKNEAFNQAGISRRQIEALREQMNLQFDRLERHLSNTENHLTDRLRTLEAGTVAMQRQYVMDRKHDADVIAAQLFADAELCTKLLAAFPDVTAQTPLTEHRITEYQKCMDRLWQGAVRHSKGPALVGPMESSLAFQEFADSLSRKNNPGHFIGLVANALRAHDLNVFLPPDRNSDGEERPLNLQGWAQYARRFNGGIQPREHKQDFKSYTERATGMKNLKEVLDTGYAERRLLQNLLPRDPSGRPMAVKLVPLFKDYEEALNTLGDTKQLVARRHSIERVGDYSPAVPPAKQTLSRNANLNNLIPLHTGLSPCPGYSKDDRSGNAIAMPTVALSPTKVDAYRKLIPEAALINAHLGRGEAGKIALCYRDVRAKYSNRITKEREVSMTVDIVFEDRNGNRLPLYSRTISEKTMGSDQAPGVWNKSRGAMETNFLSGAETANELKPKVRDASQRAFEAHLAGVFEETASTAKALVEADTQMETSELGKALRRVESAKQLLGWGIWLAYGDAASTHPEIALQFRSLPGRNQLKFYPEMADQGKTEGRKLLDTLLEGGTRDENGKLVNFTPSHGILDETLAELTHTYEKQWSGYDWLREAPGTKLKANKLAVDSLPPEVGGSSVPVLSPMQLEATVNTDRVVRAMRAMHPDMDLAVLDDLRNAYHQYAERKANPSKKTLSDITPLGVVAGTKENPIVFDDPADWQNMDMLRKTFDFLHSDKEGPQLSKTLAGDTLVKLAAADIPQKTEYEELRKHWDLLRHRNTLDVTKQKFAATLTSLTKENEANSEAREKRIREDSAGELSKDPERAKRKHQIDRIISKAREVEAERDGLFVEIREVQRDLNHIVKEMDTHSFVVETTPIRGEKNKYSDTYFWRKGTPKHPDDCSEYRRRIGLTAHHKSVMERFCEFRKQAQAIATMGDTEYYNAAKTHHDDESIKGAVKALTNVTIPIDLDGMTTLQENLDKELEKLKASKDALRGLRVAQRDWVKSGKTNPEGFVKLVNDWNGAVVRYTLVKDRLMDKRTDEEVTRRKAPSYVMPLREVGNRK